jgi:hypothetical protein
LRNFFLRGSRFYLETRLSLTIDFTGNSEAFKSLVGRYLQQTSP